MRSGNAVRPVPGTTAASVLEFEYISLVSVTKRQVSELGAEFLPENPLNLCARNRLQVGAWRHFLGVTVNRSFGARY